MNLIFYEMMQVTAQSVKELQPGLMEMVSF